MTAELHCQTQNRRALARAAGLNGIDFIELAPGGDALIVQLLNDAPAEAKNAQGKQRPKIKREHVRISGGRRVAEPRVVDVDFDHHHSRLLIKVERPNDLSPYTLEFRRAARPQVDDAWLSTFDPRLSRAPFRFRSDCPVDLDCAAAEPCLPAPRPEPEIDYLGRDYPAFTRLLFDRLALIAPDWQLRYSPDLSVALVEILAYVGDHLSYYQDAVATEAYLGTARRRVSLRRHARLVDYTVHEGCNARALVCLAVENDRMEFAPEQIRFLTVETSGPAGPTETLVRDKTKRQEPFEPLVESTGVDWQASDIFDWGKLLALLQHSTYGPVVGAELSTALQFGVTPSTLDAEDARTQALILTALHRILHDRGTSGLPPGATDEEVVQQNRRTLEADYDSALEPRGKLVFYAAHNCLLFYTWGEDTCCLPAGTTAATLLDPLDAFDERQLRLRVGDLLIFEELLSPTTGNPADADPTHRHAVRLTKVARNEDRAIKLHGPANKGQQPQCLPLVEIAWAEEDALPFTLHLSARAPADALHQTCRMLKDISVARGNVVLVDHGRQVDAEDLGVVGRRVLAAQCRCEGQPADPIAEPQRFEPALSQLDLTYTEALTSGQPASSLLRQRARAALPAIRLSSLPAAPEGDAPLFQREALSDPLKFTHSLLTALHDAGQQLSRLPLAQRHLLGRFPVALRQQLQGLVKGVAGAAIAPASSADVHKALSAQEQTWEPVPDLLESGAEERHFVVEVDDDRRARLRFGNGRLGRVPAAGECFEATYRVGNGPAGNVGAEKINRIVLRQVDVEPPGVTVRNPLPAAGGLAPESPEEIRRGAPHAFRRELARAITPEDYRHIAERHPAVQRAAAEFRGAHGRTQVRVAIDPYGREDAPPALLAQIRAELQRCRRIGHDVEVAGAIRVPLRLALRFSVRPGYQPGHVRQVLLEVFSNRLQADGRPGYFHPDALTFGDGIRVSQLVAAAQQVPGVAGVSVTELRRYFGVNTGELERGLLELQPLEIARCDNDPTYPENGLLTLTLSPCL